MRIRLGLGVGKKEWGWECGLCRKYFTMNEKVDGGNSIKLLLCLWL